MPFGKHAGMLLSDLPAAYFGWLLEQPWITDPLATGLRVEHNRRWTGRFCEEMDALKGRPPGATARLLARGYAVRRAERRGA